MPTKPGIARWTYVAAILTIAPAIGEAAGAPDKVVRVEFRSADGKVDRTVDGRVLVEAADGGILLEGREGRLWNVTPDRLKSKSVVAEKFTPLSAADAGKALLAELGDGFKVYTTRHYVIASDAGKPYSQWCGRMFERLRYAFGQHWKRDKELTLHDPAFPLSAIIFSNRTKYAEYARKDAGAALVDSVGYYSVRTNRMVLLDLSADATGTARTSRDVVRKLAASPFNAATIVHEATHQIAFNTGLHTRYADNPLWLTEGLAMYFETPDLRSPSGWRTMGKLNKSRLKQFVDYARHRRKSDSLATLIGSDKRAADPTTAGDAYAEAWALSYFLIRKRRTQYVRYVAAISKKPRLIWNKPAERLKEFQDAFGDPAALDREFLKDMARLAR